MKRVKLPVGDGEGRGAEDEEEAGTCGESCVAVGVHCGVLCLLWGLLWCRSWWMDGWMDCEVFWCRSCSDGTACHDADVAGASWGGASRADAAVELCNRGAEGATVLEGQASSTLGDTCPNHSEAAVIDGVGALRVGGEDPQSTDMHDVLSSEKNLDGANQCESSGLPPHFSHFVCLDCQRTS